MLTVLAVIIASMLDPINAAVSFLVGWTILPWRAKLIAATVVGILMVAMITYLNARAPSAIHFAAIVASISWASIAGGFRVRREKSKARALAAEAAEG